MRDYPLAGGCELPRFKLSNNNLSWVLQQGVHDALHGRYLIDPKRPHEDRLRKNTLCSLIRYFPGSWIDFDRATYTYTLHVGDKTISVSRIVFERDDPYIATGEWFDQACQIMSIQQRDVLMGRKHATPTSR